jgi:hypothetical protein
MMVLVGLYALILPNNLIKLDMCSEKISNNMDSLPSASVKKINSFFNQEISTIKKESSPREIVHHFLHQ